MTEAGVRDQLGGRTTDSAVFNGGRRFRLPISLGDLAFVLVALAVFYVRLRELRVTGAPPTVDAGNWLAFGDSLLGAGTRSSSLAYPPLVPLATKGAVGVFGLTNGVALLAAVASLAPATGLYAGLRYLGLKVVALPSALLVLGASAVGEAAAWGGFPQLLGLGLAPVVLILVDRLVRTWSLRTALTLGLLLMLLLATSHFVGFAVVLGSGVLVALSITSRAVGTAEGRRVLACLGLVLLPSAWLVPIYLPLIRAVGPISTEFKFFTPLTWSNLTSHVEFLYRDFAWLWRVLLVGSISAPVLLLGERRSTLWRVTTAMLVATVLTALITREARSTYLLTTYIGLGVALIASAWGSPRRMGGRSTVGAFAVAFLTVAGISQVVIGARFFPEQRLYYALLSPDLVSGIEEVGRSSEVADTLAVTSLHDAPLGWWVEALTRRSTYYGAPLRWLLFPDEADRARIANELFVPPFPNGETMQMAGEAGIDLILVPTRWVFFDEGAIDEFEEAFPGSVEYVSPELVAIAVTEGRP